MVELLLGKKLGMTSLFDENGKLTSVTVVELGPCYITQIRTMETDGYTALQLAFEEKKEKRTSKPLRKHFEKANVTPKRYLKEVRVKNPEDYQLGQELNADLFNDVKKVDVTAKSKGKGFAGVMKRHNFKGGRATHGFEWHRHGGSIGASAYPARVFKGQKMPGHYGDSQKTNRNIAIFKVIPERNLILVEGNVPGPKNGFVIVRRAEGER